MKTPDYQKIYHDMIRLKYPEKAVLCNRILQKSQLGFLDLIHLNTIISGNADKDIITDNQKLKSYNKQAVLQILDYQKKHKLNNAQLGRHFNLSRNTVAKWKKFFI
ncbi:hypothetical protein [Chryseobacterium sp. Leaf201]|uniref:hypothetical protein n=1 Tax=Chryseobacterium sp. Leaf201 TaxID=1735672 RepID=UPI0007007B8B|nr:hypothetical protein [Chryseobacterium sp. Leaf201]KQM55241.1 transposase [Chryseobacterium sp. Leaf201]